MTLTSPTTGRVLTADTPHSLAAGTERWPVADGIPYLRAGSEARAAEALAALDAGDEAAALAVLLAENDPWWDEAPPPREALLEVARRADSMSLRGVMDALGWGRVGTYFAHRWSDPTYLAGLTLLNTHWTRPASAFELACGIGHYLRALSSVGVADLAGADVVFGKVWVAKRWVCPQASYLCFDADAPWPITPGADLMLCTDAFYFLREKEAVATRLRAARKAYAVAHVHNARAETYSSGAAATAEALADLFPGAALYDDAGLTAAGAAGRSPTRFGAASGEPEAFSLIGGPDVATARPGPLLTPPDGARLTRNPLLTGGGVAWPSERYADEYGPIATYGKRGGIPEAARMSADVAPLVRTRDLLELPERW